jgi:CBS domain-containing protein
MRAIDLTPLAVVTVDESTSLTEAARLMREEGVGDLVIMRRDGGVNEPVGIVTDRDIVVHALACGLDASSITVADLSTRKPVTVPVDADLTEITAAMSTHGVRRVLVTSGTELAGIVSMDKVIKAMAELLNNLGETLDRQYEYEQTHLELAPAGPRAASRSGC